MTRSTIGPNCRGIAIDPSQRVPEEEIIGYLTEYSPTLVHSIPCVNTLMIIHLRHSTNI